MIKRIHVSRVLVGRTLLAAAEAHHARDVMRLQHGASVEVFDETGTFAAATLVIEPNREVSVDVLAITVPAGPIALRVNVFAAVPKGDRAEWMIEKLSELGVDRFVPLEVQRSVVVPKGTNKVERWTRIATEAAKQSRRVGIMHIDTVMSLGDAVAHVAGDRAWFLSIGDGAAGSLAACASAQGARTLSLFIGPEGGWTPEEIGQMSSAGFTAVRLTDTVLRVETAAVAAATVALTCVANADAAIVEMPIQ